MSSAQVVGLHLPQHAAPENLIRKDAAPRLFLGAQRPFATLRGEKAVHERCLVTKRLRQLAVAALHCKKCYVKSTKFGRRYITQGIISKFC